MLVLRDILELYEKLNSINKVGLLNSMICLWY